MKTPGSQLNREWHLHHRLPPNATLEQRIAWHLEHAKKCGCHDIPDKLKTEIRRRKILL